MISYTIRVPKNYPDDNGCFEVVWENAFIPFNIIKGLDSCPPDNLNYKRNKKNHWWICPKTKRDICNVHDISMFLEMPFSKEFTTIEAAVKYCIEWTQQWHLKQIKLLESKENCIL